MRAVCQKGVSSDAPFYFVAVRIERGNTMAKKAICFVDDDSDELVRFRKNLGNDFIIGAGTDINEARKDLQKQFELLQEKPRRPDLYLLDLYFPKGSRPITKEQKLKLATAREAFLKAEAKFHAVLAELGQDAQGGLDCAQGLIDENRGAIRKVAFAFFTRKATAKDVINSYKLGAVAVIKKPDPNDPNNIEGSLIDAYDLAFEQSKTDIKREIVGAIDRSNWKTRHKEFIMGAALALLLAVIAAILIEVIKYPLSHEATQPTPSPTVMPMPSPTAVKKEQSGVH
jgi:CheY-like chemotaxis protein